MVRSQPTGDVENSVVTVADVGYVGGYTSENTGV